MRQGIKESDIADFESACKQLNDVISRITQYQEDARLFVNENRIELLSNGVYDVGTDAQRDSVVSAVFIDYCDCGAF